MYSSAILILCVASTAASSICEQTYGPGSVQCGTASTAMCYNPSKGQSCCADNGYCERGQYCTPVTGYCCLVSESLQSCAANAGFAVPSKAKTFVVTRPRDTPPSTPRTPYQTSAVARQEHTLLWMVLGIGIVGVIMATF